MDNSNKSNKKKDKKVFAPAEEFNTDQAVVNKLNNLTVSDDAEDADEAYPASVINRLLAIKKLQDSIEEIDKEYKLERVAIEQKFIERKKSILEKRYHITSGQVEVEPQVENEEDRAKLAELPQDDVKGVPKFWLQCIVNHPVVSGLVAETDLPALEALVNIHVEYDEGWKGFTLTFVFEENEYFTNKELKKSYVVTPDLLDDKAPSLTNVSGTDIKWHPKKNLCMAEVKKKQKAKSGAKKGQARVITRLIPQASFFQYFSDPDMDKNDDDDDEDDEEENFKLSLDEDYEVGHAFRSEIIPEAVLWFTGEAMDDEDFDDEDEDDDDEDEDDEDDDDEDDDDEPESESAEIDGSAPNAAGDAQPAECKQS